MVRVKLLRSRLIQRVPQCSLGDETIRQRLGNDDNAARTLTFGKECMCKCDRDSADHQSDFTSGFFLLFVWTNGHAAVSVPIFCVEIQVSVD